MSVTATRLQLSEEEEVKKQYEEDKAKFENLCKVMEFVSNRLPGTQAVSSPPGSSTLDVCYMARKTHGNQPDYSLGLGIDEGDARCWRCLRHGGIHEIPINIRSRQFAINYIIKAFLI